MKLLRSRKTTLLQGTKDNAGARIFLNYIVRAKLFFCFIVSTSLIEYLRVWWTIHHVAIDFHVYIIKKKRLSSSNIGYCIESLFV